MLLNITNVDEFVEQQKSLNKDVFWDNYSLCFFTSRDSAYYSARGRFRNGKWGFLKIIPITCKGEWHVPRVV